MTDHEKDQASSVVTFPKGTKSKGKRSKGTRTRVKSAINPDTGLTDKQDTFAMLVFEGTNFSEAYRQAYDASNMSAASVHVEACKLVQHPKVSLRIDRLQRDREAEQRMQRLSRSEKVISKLEEIALRGGDADGTQVRALELLGKSMGMWIDKVETEDKTERTEEQLEKEIQEKLKRLGIA